MSGIVLMRTARYSVDKRIVGEGYKVVKSNKQTF
jgi:hypothetical protein